LEEQYSVGTGVDGHEHRLAVDPAFDMDAIVGPEPSTEHHQNQASRPSATEEGK
jgi:hypothetical protein